CALGSDHERPGYGQRGRPPCLHRPGQPAARLDACRPRRHAEKHPGQHADKVEVRLAAKGGGSENKARFAVLNPSDSVVDWILEQVPTMGGDWCPPGMLGIGIGGSAEKAMVLAKESLMGPLHMHQVKGPG